MRIIIFLVFTLSYRCICGQEPRGFIEANNSTAAGKGNTYALICGISDYKNTNITDLRFAHKDAATFYSYLLSSGIPEQNLTLLLNEQATHFNIIEALDDLCREKVKVGDELIFYFAGHGDVESRTITNLGYLLPYDSPDKLYSISAIDVRIIQDYISTASANGVSVIMIVDACHAGKLAGGQSGQRQFQNVFKEKWNNEVKILSCQPGEFSLEDEQWGNGRGLFSYQLIQGLSGKADINKDDKINLNELNIYLSTHVPESAYPVPQFPIVSGPMTATICKTNPLFVDDQNVLNYPQLGRIHIRGIKDNLFSDVNDSVKSLIDSLENELEFASTSQTPTYWYARLKPLLIDHPFLAIVQRNVAAEIINRMNINISAQIGNETYISNGYGYYDMRDSSSLITELLGEQKVKNLHVDSKIKYFNIIASNRENLSYPTDETLDQFEQLLKDDSTATYAEGFYAHLLSLRKKYERSNYYAFQSISQSPRFAFPYRTIAQNFLAMNLPDITLSICESLYDLALDEPKIQPDLFRLIAGAYFLKGDFDQATDYFIKAHFWPADTDPSTFDNNRANLLFNAGRYREAIPFYTSMATVNASSKEVPEFHGPDRSNGGQISELSNNYFRMACCYAMLQNEDSATFHLNQSLKIAMKNFNYFKKDLSLCYYSYVLNELYHQVSHFNLDEELSWLRDKTSYGNLMRKYYSEWKKELN